MYSDREDMWNTVIAAFIGRWGLRGEQDAGAMTVGEAMDGMRQADPDGYALMTEHLLWEEDDNG